ncbi:hypothetical protein BD324DRAFT_53268 [Kockovaella imperatae]|uniref:Secreted protein n=1 Tax=Kockovaella imperatae TaxID=4999 RepID=A0A1Y1UTA5_9TREE|nr:hypothetical protein BD324DRAFT_53268 [Kockovaella imperatae]ORX41259.1 hypothetical protein BD324DRAFT_53268 [Kockovaella imperatae]
MDVPTSEWKLVLLLANFLLQASCASKRLNSSALLPDLDGRCMTAISLSKLECLWMADVPSVVPLRSQERQTPGTGRSPREQSRHSRWRTDSTSHLRRYREREHVALFPDCHEARQ